jgi:hypothetical protein
MAFGSQNVSKKSTASRAQFLTSAQAQEGDEENCLELEISRTIEKSVTETRYGGVYIPWGISVDDGSCRGVETRAGLDSGTKNKGAELKFTKAGAFIDFLYNRMRVKELGAQTYSSFRFLRAPRAKRTSLGKFRLLDDSAGRRDADSASADS